MADYAFDRETLAAAQARLDEVFAAPGSREPMYDTLCAVLTRLSNQLEAHERWTGPMEPGDYMALAELEKILSVIVEELG